ncbi:heavy metal-associated isoprenylated plant protein 39-like [Cryptomeria japonica]|uniref:heavy metal-associated isoprenylated plant protein 39-like n=1 Tax=Cryptomeria japonica TaxID=3369 RepID=UPI0027D9FF38|nr:heavy metal-associated isoprenylated plant protein 39-like [Cryptomeria japonica]
MVLQLTIETVKRKRKALQVVAKVEGVDSVAVDMEEKKMTVIGKVDPVVVTSKLRKSGFCFAELVSVEKNEEEKNEGEKKEEENKDVEISELRNVCYVQRPYYDCAYVEGPYYYVDDNPGTCTIC